MSLFSVVLACAVGFLQGFVGIATTFALARPFAALIVKANLPDHSYSTADPRTRVFGWISYVISVVSLIALHIGVIEATLRELAEGDRVIRWELGQVWVVGCLAGLALARWLPVLESKIRRIGRTL